MCGGWWGVVLKGTLVFIFGPNLELKFWPRPKLNNIKCYKIWPIFDNILCYLDTSFAYGSQLSGEKNDLKILHLVAEILGKNPVSFFWSENFLETRKFYFTKNFSSKKNVVQKNLGPERFGSKEVCSKKFH